MTQARSAPFAGWWVVGAVFLLLATTSGLGFYGLSIYLDALTDEQGFSTTSVSLATSVFFIVSGLVGRAVAPVIETRDVRLVVGAGGVVSAAALLLLGRVETIPGLYGVYIVFGVGFALAGLVPGTTIVTRWFHVRRARALAVASTGLSVGGLTLTVLASRLIDDRGLRDTTPILAGLYLLLVGCSLVGLWPSPAQRGLRPDGATGATVHPADHDPSSGADGVDYAEAIRSRFFALICATFVLAMGAQVGGIAQLAKLGTERVDRPTGALAVSALALGSVLGRLAGGMVADRLPMIGFTMTLAGAQALTLGAIAFADSGPALVIAAFLFGTTIGNLLMLQPLVIADAFGVRAYPRIFALQQLVVTGGVAGGPFILGFLHDNASYRASYLTAAVLSAGAGAVLLFGAADRPLRTHA